MLYFFNGTIAIMYLCVWVFLIFFYVFVAVCRLFLVAARRGYSLFVVCRLMTAGPPLVVRRLLAHRLQ